MDDSTFSPPPPPPPDEGWQAAPQPEQTYPLTPPASPPPARRPRVRIAAAFVSGAAALATGTFFIGQAVASGASAGAGSTPAISTAAANAAAAAGSGSTSSTACVAPGVAAGTLKAVNGTTLTITEKDGKDVTVTTSASTKITKVVAGSLSDIRPGETIGVHGTANGQTAINADNIAVVPSDMPGKLGGLATRGAKLLQPLGFALGTVKSVSGNTITLQEPDGTTVTVTTSASTKVEKAISAQVKDLTVGQPVVATGTANANGSIAANRVVQGSVDLGLKGFGIPGLGRAFQIHPGDLPSPPTSPAAG